MDVVFTRNGSASIVSSKKIQSEVIINKKKQSSVSSFKDGEHEFIYYNNSNGFVYDKLLTEIKSVDVGEGDLWGDLALNYTVDPILLLENQLEEIYEYMNLDGTYFRRLDYILNTDTFYKNYQNGVLSEVLIERNF